MTKPETKTIPPPLLSFSDPTKKTLQHGDQVQSRKPVLPPPPSSLQTQHRLSYPHPAVSRPTVKRKATDEHDTDDSQLGSELQSDHAVGLPGAQALTYPPRPYQVVTKKAKTANSETSTPVRQLAAGQTMSEIPHPAAGTDMSALDTQASSTAIVEQARALTDAVNKELSRLESENEELKDKLSTMREKESQKKCLIKRLESETGKATLQAASLNKSVERLQRAGEHVKILRAVAEKVVRYAGGDWEAFGKAIAELKEVVGKAKPESN